MKIYDYNLSEALFWFVHENKSIYDDLCAKNALKDYSIAEFVDEYHREEFQNYAYQKFNISVEYD